jgi:hypothetical protein
MVTTLGQQVLVGADIQRLTLRRAVVGHADLSDALAQHQQDRGGGAGARRDGHHRSRHDPRDWLLFVATGDNDLLDQTARGHNAQRPTFVINHEDRGHAFRRHQIRRLQEACVRPARQQALERARLDPLGAIEVGLQNVLRPSRDHGRRGFGGRHGHARAGNPELVTPHVVPGLVMGFEQHAQRRPRQSVKQTVLSRLRGDRKASPRMTAVRPSTSPTSRTSTRSLRPSTVHRYSTRPRARK